MFKNPTLLKWLLVVFLFVATLLPLNIPIESLQILLRKVAFALSVLTMLLIIRIPSERPKLLLNLIVLGLLIALLILNLIGPSTPAI